ncbi:hypothetical protein PVK64_02010 [Aliivibrio sp. S4TY2]|uniref:hypothetical protein n=1 Tax=unclassified Aliivibrio TaxID=2645654 RepID=UPI002379A549|nr:MULTISPECIES: hypothetical protein [unclassified Aliivibrio]MDD9154967.1 hypothetical protein [Aliivibrio sp. S4TY2]MDD9158670.1 hypothetical protein [Aliivibrio sp. S4TY1]MDD9162970.1 hypothetical protein [Aliivibrio sp. S4MY2]MDD9166669.1 hypothetical protein [Aliivibrio sp. S4MY4]MDD9184047.1 hypothetical protein [Aliivibrio sp. S4MY3]
MKKHIDYCSEVDSCFLLKLNKEAWQEVKTEVFRLASGDVLQIGDCFTQLGSRGSAGNQPIILTRPWVQRYIGKLLVDDDVIGFPPSYRGRFMILFEAINMADITEGFVSKKKSADTYSRKDGYAMAYLDTGDGKLFHIRSSGSSSICQCDSLKRITVPVDTL